MGTNKGYHDLTEPERKRLELAIYRVRKLGDHVREMNRWEEGYALRRSWRDDRKRKAS